MRFKFRLHVFCSGALLGGVVLTVQAATKVDAPEVSIGERLFLDSRFAQRFFADGNGEVNMPDGSGEAALVNLAQAKVGAPKIRAPFADQAINCRACHLVDELRAQPQLPGRGVVTYNDFARRSPVPQRTDGRVTTVRNAQSLVGAMAGGPERLFHFDGEFTTMEALIIGTYTGRNLGWLPEEQAAARKHFANVIRKDKARDELAEDYGRIPYKVLLSGTDPSIPAGLRLPEKLRLDVDKASDDEVLLGCAKLVTAYVASLQFGRDARGEHNGSPYDAFLAANDLPRGPAAGEGPRAYADRLRDLLGKLATPKFVDEPNRRFKYHEQPFHFGEFEWRGLKIFFGVASDTAPAGGGAVADGAGNCAACHTPPHFTDFAFHNTGTTQEDFDALNGAGRFAQHFVPTLAERDTDYDAWLPPTPQHPKARGPFFSVPMPRPPPHTDLGLWNVYGNPDLPEPQPAIERLLNPDGKLTREEVLASALARFKTPGLRDLGQSPPYLHTGRFETLEEVVKFYERASTLARAGKLRNAPPEFAGMRLSAGDVAALVAFLRALNEDYE